jgi:hypothetical protein
MSPETPSPEPVKPRDQRTYTAYRHGLTGHVLILPPDEEIAYKQHTEGIHAAFRPKGAMESSLTQLIADDSWRLHRAAAMETNILSVSLDDPQTHIAHHEQIDSALGMARLWLAGGKDLGLLTLYENRLQRRVERNIALLRSLQKERREALEKVVEEVAILPESYEFPAEALPLQFDFSPTEIRTLARHHRRLSEVPKPQRRAA